MDDDLIAKHTTAAIRIRLGEARSQSYLRDFIYGAVDGAVTTFAVVASVAATGLSSGIVLLLGVANLLADGFSMAAGNYLGTKADAQTRDATRKQEEFEVEHAPDGEREEIRQIFAEKGFEGETLDAVVNVITSDKKRWVDTMLMEEHGLALESSSPIKAAWVTYGAFVSVGAIPLVTFVIDYFKPDVIAQPFGWSMGLTAVAFFVVGALKSRFVERSWWLEGGETLGVGTLAAGIAYGIGLLLKPLVEGAL